MTRIILIIVAVLLVGILRRNNAARQLLVWTAVLFMLWCWGAEYTRSNPWNLWGADSLLYYFYPCLVVPVIIVLVLPNVREKFARNPNRAFSPVTLMVVVLAVIAMLLVLSTRQNRMLMVEADKFAEHIMECYSSTDQECMSELYGPNSMSRFLFFRINDYDIRRGVFVAGRYKYKENHERDYRWEEFIRLLYSIKKAEYVVHLEFEDPELVPNFCQLPLKLRLSRQTKNEWSLGGTQEIFFSCTPPSPPYKKGEPKYFFDLVEAMPDEEIVEIILTEKVGTQRYFQAWNHAKIRRLVIEPL